jgi:hypothetical protein
MNEPETTSTSTSSTTRKEVNQMVLWLSFVNSLFLSVCTSHKEVTKFHILL